MNEDKLIEMSKEHAIDLHELYPTAERDSLKALCKPYELCTDIYRTALRFDGATIQKNDDRDFDWLLNCDYFSDEDEINDEVKDDDIIIILAFEIEESIYYSEDESIDSEDLGVEVYCFVSNGDVMKSIVNPY